MLTTSTLEEGRVRLVTVHEPFEMDELAVAAQKDMASTGKAIVFGQPFVLDFRGVNLLRFDTSDFQRLIKRRLAIDNQRTLVPCAMVAGNDGCFGMLRMYAVYAEIAGLRSEADTFVSLSMEEAVSWLIERGGQEGKRAPKAPRII